jgi:hypothetical protein
LINDQRREILRRKEAKERQLREKSKEAKENLRR